jgi:hypothetical protein
MVKQMLFMDAPAHTRIRALASQAFTPQRISALHERIREIVIQLLDRVAPNAHMDALRDFAEPLPYTITAQMLGVHTKDGPQLKKWSQDFAEMLGNFQHNPGRALRSHKSLESMIEYFRSAIRHSAEHPRNGLINAFLTAEIHGDRFDEDEVVANVILTMVGGQETTTNLIGNGVLTLVRHPADLWRLQQDPSQIPSAVEEMLRFEPPSQYTARLAPFDTELGGKQICRRQAVIAVLAAANRDPVRFAEPDRFDILRQDNKHLSFGWGAHFCFGAGLARLEAQIALEEMLARFSGWSLETEALSWRSNLGLRGLIELPITFVLNNEHSNGRN